MIGIVITAHDEAEHIGATLAAVTQAATHPALHGELVRVMVVLDSCDDATGAIAETHGAAHGVKTLPLSARNVGMARAAGATRMLGGGARWLAASLPRFYRRRHPCFARLAGQAAGAGGRCSVQLDRHR